MKKLFCALLSVVMLLGLFPVVSFAAEQPRQVKIGVITYQIENGEAAVYRCDDVKGKVTVLGEVADCPVTRVIYNAFAGCKEIT